MKTQRIVNVGVGGQGNLLASNLIGMACVDAGLPVMVSEIHGMAQRGGVVESAVIIGEVKSPLVSDGEADILVSFEPVETLRLLGRANKDTLVLTNTRPLPPFTVAIGSATYPDTDAELQKAAKRVRRLIL
jgi:indolepyruvate ferredoxin oxidoreductase beta subunit